MTSPPCASFEPDKGGAHPWCRHCGWQRSEHELRPMACDRCGTNISAAGRSPGDGHRYCLTCPPLGEPGPGQLDLFEEVA